MSLLERRSSSSDPFWLKIRGVFSRKPRRKLLDAAEPVAPKERSSSRARSSAEIVLPLWIATTFGKQGFADQLLNELSQRVVDPRVFTFYTVQRLDKEWQSNTKICLFVSRLGIGALQSRHSLSCLLFFHSFQAIRLFYDHTSIARAGYSIVCDDGSESERWFDFVNAFEASIFVHMACGLSGQTVKSDTMVSCDM